MCYVIGNLRGSILDNRGSKGVITSRYPVLVIIPYTLHATCLDFGYGLANALRVLVASLSALAFGFVGLKRRAPHFSPPIKKITFFQNLVFGIVQLQLSLFG